MSKPSTVTRPAVGGSRPSNTSTSVLFPAQLPVVAMARSLATSALPDDRHKKPRAKAPECPTKSPVRQRGGAPQEIPLQNRILRLLGTLAKTGREHSTHGNGVQPAAPPLSGCPLAANSSALPDHPVGVLARGMPNGISQLLP